MAQRVKHLPAMQETWVWSLGGEDPLEKEMATHSSILAWKTPWMEKPGGLQSMESQRVRHNWVSSLSNGKESACNAGDQSSISGSGSGRSPGERNGNPLQYSCLENPMDGGAWRATAHGLTESDTTEWVSTSTASVTRKMMTMMRWWW